MEGRKFTKLKENCLDNSILLFCLGFVWISSALVSYYELPNLAILIFLIGSFLIKLLVKLARKSLNLPKAGENSSLLLSCLTIGMPFGLLVVFFPFVENINIFYPAFSLILGVIFAVSSQTGKNKGLFWLAILLITGSVYTWFNYNDELAPGGMISGIFLLSFSAYYRVIPAVNKLFNIESKSSKTIPVRNGI